MFPYQWSAKTKLVSCGLVQQPSCGHSKRNRSLGWAAACLLLWAMPLYTEVAPTPPPPDAPAGTNFFARHFKFVTAEVGSHYRYVDTGPGKVTINDQFYKISTRVQINLAANGTTYLHLRGESGRAFNGSHDYTGIGRHAAYWSYNLKSFYVGQKLGPNFEAQGGGIDYDQGVGSEITYTDNDGWMEGYRLRYAGPGRRYYLPNKLSVTVGYMGDFLKPNVFSRFSRMGDENYIQVLGSKKLGEAREVSAEFDSIQGIRFARQAFRWQKLRLFVVDDVLLEAMTRSSDDATFGWAGTLFRTLDKRGRFRAGMFYSDMPAGMFIKRTTPTVTTICMNGDYYPAGKRVGPMLRVIPFKNFEVNLMGAGRLDNTVGTRYRGHVMVRYSFADLLNRALQYAR